jgi:hypothetical protein
VKTISVFCPSKSSSASPFQTTKPPICEPDGSR